MQEPHETYEFHSQESITKDTTAIKPKNTKMLGTIVVIALICSILGSLVGAGCMYLSVKNLKTEASNIEESQTTTILEGIRDNVVLSTSQINTNALMTQSEVYAANVNSTVGITTSITTNYWGYPTTSAASGSGFILSTDGYILTNYHVIENSNAITVTLYNGSTYEATLVGYDEDNDIAVLKVEASDLVPVILGNSDQINVGDEVVAIGNPLGELTFSLTAGSISAKDREITMSNGSTMRLLQTDCAINSGNSGGALFNLYGEVIGITNAKYSSNSSGASIDNIGFAIPINKTKTIVESIIEKGYVSKPYIGVSVADVSAEMQNYGLPKGAAIKTVVEESPAQQAGLHVNDIITHVNDEEISGNSDLISIISNASVGDIFVLSVYRQGNTMELSITVGEKIQTANEQENSQDITQQIPRYGK